MKRKTGIYRETKAGDERFKAFIPYPLPPKKPALKTDGEIAELHDEAAAALEKLSIAGAMVPSPEWYLYGFVRKEALISSQIEGTQATLEDVAVYEATSKADRPADAEEVCNYVKALNYARKELARPKGLPICTRLLCGIHKRLMQGIRGADKQPGGIRRSQNWVGGTRPGNARFVPPPAETVYKVLGDLEKWIHKKSTIPPLIRAGLAHVQFETIHPFLDGNGRIGRLLISLLVEEWGLLRAPFLYLSVAFKRHRQKYYSRLSEVRDTGDWEAWTVFFLQCVKEAADDGIQSAARLFDVISRSRQAVISHKTATVTCIRLFEQLSDHPVVTLPLAIDLTGSSKPTAGKAIEALCRAGVLEEITGKRRDRIYAFHDYLNILAEDTGSKPG